VALTLGSRSPVRTIDDEFADLATTIPGFGGMYIDENGVLNVFVTNPPAAVPNEPIEAILTKLGEGPRAQSLAASKLIRKGDYDYRQLRDWFVTLNAVGDHAITFRDIDEKVNRIVLGAADETQIARIQGLIAPLSIPSGAVKLVVKKAVTPTTSLQDYYRPIIGGFQIGFPTGNLCTLGFTAFLQYWWGVDSSRAYFVTNSHCTGSTPGPGGFGVVTGIQAGQPTLPSGGEVMGTEVADPALFTNAEDPVNCPVGAHCRWSDAALFHIEPVPGGFWHATVELPNPGITLADSYGIAEVSTDPFSSPLVGTAVFKVGRTTGWSWGSVDCTCFTALENITNVTLLCQSSAPYTSAGGDSGSPVMTERYSQYPTIHNAVKLVGINWGSDGYDGFFSIFERVSTELGRFGMGADGLYVTRSN